MASDEPKIVAKFTGDGTEYHNGIPAADLDEQTFKNLSDEQKATVVLSPLYEVQGQSKEVREAKASAKRVETEHTAQATDAAQDAGGDK